MVKSKTKCEAGAEEAAERISEIAFRVGDGPLYPTKSVQLPIKSSESGKTPIEVTWKPDLRIPGGGD
jgi:hypothetical protein